MGPTDRGSGKLFVAVAIAALGIGVALPRDTSAAGAAVAGRSSSFDSSGHSSGRSSDRSWGHGWHGWGGWGGWGWGGWGRWGWWGWPAGSSFYYRDRDAARWAAVKTDVEPDEASVYLDGKFIGIADNFDGFPGMLYLGRGQFQLEFRLQGFTTWTTSVDAAPGRFFDLKHQLEKIPHSRQYGTYDPPEPPGGVVRYFTKRDGGVSGDGRPGKGDTHAVLESAPAPVEPRILFRVEPADAAVYLDDKYIGTGRELEALEKGMLVAAGSHRVTAIRPGYREETRTVEVTPEGKSTLDITLIRQ